MKTTFYRDYEPYIIRIVEDLELDIQPLGFYARTFARTKKDIRYKTTTWGKCCFYSEQRIEIVVNRMCFELAKGSIKVKRMLVRTLMHELRHAYQYQKGLLVPAKGSNTAYWKKKDGSCVLTKGYKHDPEEIDARSYERKFTQLFGKLWYIP